MREVAEMLYEWERPFVVDDRAFRSAFGGAFGEPTPIGDGVEGTTSAALASLRALSK